MNFFLPPNPFFALPATRFESSVRMSCLSSFCLGPSLSLYLLSCCCHLLCFGTEPSLVVCFKLYPIGSKIQERRGRQQHERGVCRSCETTTRAPRRASAGGNGSCQHGRVSALGRGRSNNNNNNNNNSYYSVNTANYSS